MKLSNGWNITTTQGNLLIDGGGQTWANAGTIQANGGNLTLQNGVFAGGAYNASVGTLRLNDAFIEGGAAPLAINVASGATLAGNGALFLGTGTSFTNQGTIMADMHAVPLLIDGGGQTWMNAGTIEANGGVLSLSHGTFQGGTFSAVNGGTLQVGATIGHAAGARLASPLRLMARSRVTSMGRFCWARAILFRIREPSPAKATC